MLSMIPQLAIVMAAALGLIRGGFENGVFPTSGQDPPTRVILVQPDWQGDFC
jgi:hypothetical protein